MTPSPRLLTIAETATALSCSEANVYALIEAGKLPYVAVGKRKGYRITVEDIQTFIDSLKVEKRPTETRPPVRLVTPADACPNAATFCDRIKTWYCRNASSLSGPR